jgi:hypothetical protein
MIVANEQLRQRIADAVGRLITTRQFGETALVSLPVMYPSGAFAGVHVTVSGDKCFVSDSAIGYREADLAGVGDYFDAAARDAAEWFGVNYDGASVFVASAALSRIEGAIIGVATASSSAVTRALLRAAEAKEQSRNSAVFEIVSEVYGHTNVTKQQEVAGKEASWEAHNVVLLEGRRAIFEFVSNHTNSIASKFLMFSDIGRIEDPPALNSVVEALETLGPKGTMLHDVSNVIPLNASRETFRQYARAA